MNMNEYQERARATAFYPGMGGFLGLVYVILKLNGEAGEAAEHLGKALRDDHSLLEKRKDALRAELGDVLWYVANAAAELEYSLEDIAKENLAKLRSRQIRGVLGGDGDDR